MAKLESSWKLLHSCLTADTCCQLEHVHMASPCGLGFFTAWWLGPKAQEVDTASSYEQDWEGGISSSSLYSYWQESFRAHNAVNPFTGCESPSRWLLGSQMRFQILTTSREYWSSGHNLVSHFFTISFWFSEVGQENENCWSTEWKMTFQAADMGRAGIYT